MRANKCIEGRADGRKGYLPISIFEVPATTVCRIYLPSLATSSRGSAEAASRQEDTRWDKDTDSIDALFYSIIYCTLVTFFTCVKFTRESFFPKSLLVN
jgi:hypothetical protein